MDFADINAALAGTGLITRGGFHLEAGDIPEGFSEAAATVVLIGNAGPEMWAAFAAQTTPEERDNDANPLDDWTRETLEKAARGLGCRALFPFTGPPYYPFQQWALKGGGVFVSPTGPLIHPQFGLWHAYRGALVFEQRLALAVPPRASSPCAACADKPCRGACPADAFATGGYDVPACVGHVASAAGTDCRDSGCLARRACPVGREYLYAPDQAQFHMAKYLKAQGWLE
ncbi:MAG TPA: ferredoxin [Rhodospirillales bacterium]|jgi:hypothetical protein|nr:ferredoxin [Rhodospirillales bacterium]